MSDSFYTNVISRRGKILMRGFSKRSRVQNAVAYQPYVFLQMKEGTYRTIDGKSVDKVDFENIYEAKNFLKKYENVSNMTIYGLTNFEYLYIFDTFKGEINYDPSMVRIGYLDIECMSDDGFPDITKAEKEITAITIKVKNKYYVFGCGEFTTKDENVYYFKCKDEYELLSKFIQRWQALDLDVVTGWNIEFFDIPYLVNRIKNVLGDYELKKLSPWGYVDEKTVEFKGRYNQSYSLVGISILDYYHLYRKFTFGNQESYTLDYICKVELGLGKLDYSEYGSLAKLFKNNFQKYIEYNIVDVERVGQLDDKLKFLEQVMALAYDAKVNYNDTMTTVRPWDVIIHNYLLERGYVIPPMNNNVMSKELVGGHVKDVKPNMYKWVVSFDLNSLYPHLIMQYNISPDTYAGRLTEFTSIDDIIRNNDMGYKNNDSDNGINYAVAANGTYYRKNRQGFLAQLMEKMYDDRTKYKKLMIEAKQRYEKDKNSEDEMLIARYHNMQLAKKIQLNSAYGALGNIYFRWFDFNLAEAITMSGQLSIRWIEKKINEYMNNLLKTKDIDYVIASDTDSIYITMENLVNQIGETDDLKIVNAIDKFCENKIQPYINKCYEDLAHCMNAYQQKMQMKRETIANKGIWKAKKMYILNAWNVEGVQYDKPKLKIQGIEAVRSSTPHVCREKIKQGLEIIMNKDENDLKEFVKKFKSEFYNLPFEDVASPRGVNGIEKYYDKKTIYISGTPIHVKASLLFNELLKKHNNKTIPPIQDGDKIKFCYLKQPNPIHESVIASSEGIPPEFNIDKYIDKELQFTKTFLEPLKSITSIIDWEVENRSTLEDFFNG